MQAKEEAPPKQAGILQSPVKAKKAPPPVPLRKLPPIHLRQPEAPPKQGAPKQGGQVVDPLLPGPPGYIRKAKAPPPGCEHLHQPPPPPKQPVEAKAPPLEAFESVD